MQGERLRARFDKLKKFSHATRGDFFDSKASLRELRAAFAQINQEIKNQYSIGYVSTNPKRDDSFRKIKIRIGQPGFEVRHREGYYSSQDSSEANS